MKKCLRVLGMASAGTTIALVILLSGALLFEGLTRAAYHLYSRRFIHPYLGETQKPSSQKTDYTPDGEAFLFTSNNYGFRGANIPEHKPHGARYVFAIGGSTTACNEYPHERTWPGLLERQLRHILANDRIHVYNAGMGHGTSYRSLTLFLNVITHLNPDLVIMYEGVNDKGPFVPTSARYFREIGRGEDFLHRPSYLLYELALHTRNHFITKMARSLYPPALPHIGFDYHEKNYRDISYLAKGYGIPLMFMTQPIMPYPTMPQSEDNKGINRSTQDLGRELNVPVFDLAATMPLDYQHFLADGVHYTARGNLWIADHLAQWMVDHQLL